MGLFTKVMPCENCGNITRKKQICHYYDSWQGNPKSKYIKLCPQCALEKFHRSLVEARAKAVVIQPEEKYHAINYFEFDRINAQDDNEEFSACMKEALPREGQPCEKCGGESFYTWCSLDILNNDIMNWEPFPDDYEREYLCKECLAKSLKQKLEEEDIHLSVILPAYGGEGFYIPF
jgi:hypothetical protein